MREIKFRIWNKTLNEWGVLTFPTTPDWDNIDKEIGMLQFTELKDKNEKEIYEGDIVLHEIWHGSTNWKFPYVVEYSSGEYVIKQECLNNYPKTIPLKFVTIRCLNKKDRIEIIGNIYNNPELLKSQQL